MHVINCLQNLFIARSINHEHLLHNYPSGDCCFEELLFINLYSDAVISCYLTGGHSRSTGTDHGISDSVITPVLLALSRAEQRQAGLLEVAGAC